MTGANHGRSKVGAQRNRIERVTSPPERSRWRLVLRVALAVLVLGACAWFMRGLEWKKIGAALASASPAWVAAAAVLNLVQVVLRAALVRALLAPVARISTARLVRYSFTTFAANNLLPGRAGELVRIYLLSSREGVPAASAVSVALVEKAIELLAMLLVVAPLPLLLPALPPSVSLAVELLAAGGLLALAGVWALARFVRVDAAGWLARFAEGAHVIRSARGFAVALGFAVAVWVADAVGVWLVLRALDLQVHWVAPLLVLLVLNIAIALPSTPAQVGPFEAAAAGSLALLGVPAEPALAFAILYHAMQAIPVTLLGAPGLRLARAVAHEPAGTPSSDAKSPTPPRWPQPGTGPG